MSGKGLVRGLCLSLIDVVGPEGEGLGWCGLGLLTCDLPGASCFGAWSCPCLWSSLALPRPKPSVAGILWSPFFAMNFRFICAPENKKDVQGAARRTF